MVSESETNMINVTDIGILGTSDDACYIDIIGAIIVKGAEICALFGAGTNKVAKILATFRNYTYLCSVRMYVLAIRVESRVG